MADLTFRLQEIAGAEQVAPDAPLAPFTTFGIGGHADWLVEARSVEQVDAVLAVAADVGVPVTVLGGGSNVLVADAGIRGIVLRIRVTEIVAMSPTSVRAGAGVSMNGLVRWLIGQGLAGLESWAGTPGTVGGAIFGNAHYGGRNISEYITRVGVMSPGGGMVVVPVDAMGFAYDTSRLQTTREIAVWAEFQVGSGTPDALRAVARASLAHRKRTQPLHLPSAGCIFQNPDPARDRLPEGMPWSAGALVDRAGLKGHRVGGAQVSTVHANFFVTDGTATASDVRSLIERAREAVRQQFGVQLKEEIMYLGEW